MNEIYLYFRAQTNESVDLDQDDSVLYPLSSFSGFQSGTANNVNTVTMSFKPLENVFDNDATDAAVSTDTVVINLSSGSSPKDFMEHFTEQINTIKNKQDKFFVIGDNATSEYFSKTIASVGTITIPAEVS
tara:strand:+ start:227 stop:619 length:393 start_codon:yes stop_codon:yes gene_type:complete